MIQRDSARNHIAPRVRRGEFYVVFAAQRFNRFRLDQSEFEIRLRLVECALPKAYRSPSSPTPGMQNRLHSHHRPSAAGAM